MANTLQIGQATEAAALQFLLRHGLSLITKNYRCQFGGSASSITAKKQKK